MSSNAKRKHPEESIANGDPAGHKRVHVVHGSGITVTQAIPFIIAHPPKGKSSRCTYSVTPEAIEFLRTIKAPFGVLSVVGKYRTGKSALLNRVILNLPAGQGFDVGVSIQAQTKGLWLYKALVRAEAVGRSGAAPIDVLVLDTEGLSSMQTNGDSTHDITTFAIAWLLSTSLCYNMVGAIDGDSMRTLNLVVEVSKQITAAAAASSTTSSGSSEHKQSTSTTSASVTQISASATASASVELDPEESPHLWWVLRDFLLQLVDKQGHSITATQHLESILSATGSEDAQHVEICNALKKVFPVRHCATLVRPCDDDRDLQNLCKPDSKVQLRPQFVQQSRALRNQLLADVRPKKVMGKEISGATFAQWSCALVEAVNRGSIPVMRDYAALLSESHCRTLVDETLAQWAAMEKKAEIGQKMYVPDELASMFQDQWTPQLISEYRKKAFGPPSEIQKWEHKCQEAMDQRGEQSFQANLRAIRSHLKHVVEQVLKPRLVVAKSIDEIRQLLKDEQAAFAAKLGGHASAHDLWASSMLEPSCSTMVAFFEAQAAEHGKLVAEFARLQQEHDTHRKESVAEKQNLSQQIERLRQESDAKVAEWNLKTEALQKQHQEQSLQQQAQFDVEKKRLQTERDDAGRALSLAQDSLLQQQSAAIEQQQTSQSQLQTLTQQLSDRNEQLSALTEELQAVKAQCTQLQADMATLTQLNMGRQVLEEQVQSLTQQLASEQRARNETRNEYMSTLTNVHAEYKVKLKKWADQSARDKEVWDKAKLEYEREHRQLINQGDHDRDKIQLLTRACKECEVALESEKKRSADKETLLSEQLTKQRQQAHEDKVAFEDKWSKAQHDLAEESKARRMQELKHTEERHNESMNAMRKTAQLENEAKLAQAKCADLKVQLEGLSKIRDAEKAARKEIEELKMDGIRHASTISALQQKNANLQQTVDERQAQLRDLDSKLLQLFGRGPRDSDGT